MNAGDAFGRGVATEAATAVVGHASSDLRIIATVDVPNVGAIRVLEKLGFQRESQIEAYGSSGMYLYRLASV